MLYAVVKKELLHHVVSYRFLVSSAMLVALAGLVTLAGTADYNLRLEAYETQLAEHAAELRAVRVYSYLQPVVLRPPEVLSVLERGWEGRRGNEVRVHLFAVPEAAAGTDRGNPFMDLFHSFDLTTIIGVVLGLQALLLTFDAVVGEREQSNLQLVLAQAVGRAQVLTGKFLGAFLALLAPLFLSALLSLAILGRNVESEWEAHDAARLGGLLGAYTAYLALMLLLGLLISLTSRSASRALALAVLSWWILVILLPQATFAGLGAVATRPHDLADLENAVDRLEQERDRLLAEIWHEDPLRTRPSGDLAPVVQTSGNRAVLRRYGSADHYASLAGYYRREIALGLDYAERIYALRRRVSPEHRWAALLARALPSPSPSYLLDRIAASFAGTSADEHETFLAACRAYRQDLILYLGRKSAFGSWRWFTDDPAPARPWPTLLELDPEDVDEANFREVFNRFLEPEIQQRIQRELGESDPEKLLDLDDLPPFRFQGTGLVPAVRRVGFEIALLLGSSGLLAVVAWRRFERYEAE